MKQSLLYFLAAALFLIAAGLSFANDGPDIKMIAGLLLAGVMAYLGLNLRRAGK